MFTHVGLSGEPQNVWHSCGLILAGPEVDDNDCSDDDDDDEEEGEGETPKGKREEASCT